METIYSIALIVIGLLFFSGFFKLIGLTEKI
jgi:hypothetical protein